MSFYCPRIKNGIAFTPNGRFDVCGVRNLNTTSLIKTSESLDSFLNSDYRQNLQNCMKNKVWPTGCESCSSLENKQLISSRQVEIQLENTSGELPYVHIHTSNLCDSDCIMCGPRWSSSIAARLIKFPDPNNVLFTLGTQADSIWSNDSIIKNIEQAISMSKRIKILGGEPFIDKKLWKLLDRVANNDTVLILITNGNTRPSKFQQKVLNKFKSIELAISIDATDKLYEWVRSGLSWKTLLQNLAYFKSMKNTQIQIISVVQAHTIQNLFELHTFFSKLKMSVVYDILYHPSMLAPQNVPKEILNAASIQCNDIPRLKQLVDIIQNQVATCDTNMLKKHTEYLNSHRKYKFNTEKWSIE